MALFPPQFLVGVLVAFFQIRLRPYCNLASYLLRGLKFFLPPEDEMLKQIGAVTSTKESTNGTLKKRSKTSSSSSRAVKELSPDERMERFYLKLGTIEMNMIEQTLFFDLFEMMIVILSSTLVAFFFGETWTLMKLFMYNNSKNTIEVSDSILHTSTSNIKSIDISLYGLFSAFLVCLWFPFKVKFAHGFQTYEARLGFGIGIIGFIVSLFVLLAPKNLFDFDMEAAIEDLGKRLMIVCKTLGFQEKEQERIVTLGQIGKSILLLIMALLGGIFTCTCFLPAFRFARMYLEMTSTNLFQRILLHLNMFLPILVCTCWMKKLATDFFVPIDMKPCQTYAMTRDCFHQTLIEDQQKTFSFGWKESTWNRVRIGIVFFTFLVRLLCLRDHLQFFLIEIKDAIVRIVQRPGKKTIDGNAILHKIRIQFNYLPVIAIQYLAPFGGLLAAGLIFKYQTGTTFYFYETMVKYLFFKKSKSLYLLLLSDDKYDNSPPDFGGFRLEDDKFLFKEKIFLIMKGMSHFQLLTGFFHRQFFGFFIWWQSFVWSLLSVFGLMYWKNTPHSRLLSQEEEEEGQQKQGVGRGINRQTPKLFKNRFKKHKK